MATSNIFSGEKGLLIKGKIFNIIRKESHRKKIPEGEMVEKAQDFVKDYIDLVYPKTSDSCLEKIGDLFE